MVPPKPLPANLEPVRDTARRALSPVKPADPTTRVEKTFLFMAKRTEAGRQLPQYYLVYFLLVELLGFKNLGQGEKVAWSVPIDYQGRAFLIEHRKLGVGVFAHDPVREEQAAKEIVVRVQKAVVAARPFFDWLAGQAIAASAVNVINNSNALFERYTFLLNASRGKLAEAERRKDEHEVEKGETPDGVTWSTVSYPAYQIRREAKWLAMSAIEAFFSWTEHVFIHLAILNGQIASAHEVASLAESDWPEKFKAAVDLSDQMAKDFFDKLLVMRRELRNYIAHGAFGKQGEAFTFHSGAGAVPVLLPHRLGTRQFKFGPGLAFDSAAALNVIEEFTRFLWSGVREPAQLYIQESGLPVILTMAADGSYQAAMQSSELMKDLVDNLTYLFGQAADMDW